MVQMLQHVVLDMVARSFGWQQVTRPRIPSESGEGISDAARVFARNQNAPNQTLERMTTAFTVFFEARRWGRGSHTLSFSLGHHLHTIAAFEHSFNRDG